LLNFKPILEGVGDEGISEGPMPIISTGGSLAADMKMGWKPKGPISGAPIPLFYEFDQYTHMNPDPTSVLLYLGPRLKNSSILHKQYARKPF
jgi:hypothetical protein